MTSLGRAVLAPAVLTVALLSGCAAQPPNASPVDDEQATVESEASVEEIAVNPAPTAEANEEAAPAPPPAAPSYAAGDAFNETCSVAWPSAPQVTSTDIQITSFCPNVPSSFPVVLVVYPDPSLPITASTGSFQVVGEVYGSAESPTGMPYLIVLADEVRL
jgi:hypothetical protein